MNHDEGVSERERVDARATYVQIDKCVSLCLYLSGNTKSLYESFG